MGADFWPRRSQRLWLRAKLTERAVTLCTAIALLVCTLIAVLFLSAFLRFDVSLSVALMFIAAMLAFFLGLLWFLREIYLVTVSLRIGARSCPQPGR